MADVKVAEKSTIGFGKAEKKLLTDPLDSNNPITVQVLGICSALAVTTGMKNAAVMAVAVIVVTASGKCYYFIFEEFHTKGS